MNGNPRKINPIFVILAIVVTVLVLLSRIL
jgi:hypothetical protein